MTGIANSLVLQAGRKQAMIAPTDFVLQSRMYYLNSNGTFYFYSTSNSLKTTILH